MNILKRLRKTVSAKAINNIALFGCCIFPLVATAGTCSSSNMAGGVLGVFENGVIEINDGSTTSWKADDDVCNISIQGATTLNVLPENYYEPNQSSCGVSASGNTVGNLALPDFEESGNDRTVKIKGSTTVVYIDDVKYKQSSGEWCGADVCGHESVSDIVFPEPESDEEYFYFENSDWGEIRIETSSHSLYFKYDNSGNPYHITNLEGAEGSVMVFEPGSYFLGSLEIGASYLYVRTTDDDGNPLGDGSGKVRFYVKDTQSKPFNNGSCINYNNCDVDSDELDGSDQNPERLAVFSYENDLVLYDRAKIAASLYSGGGDAIIRSYPGFILVGELLADNISVLNNENVHLVYQDTETFAEEGYCEDTDDEGSDGDVPANAAPKAEAVSAITYSGVSVDLALVGIDADSMVLNYMLVSQPQNGSATISGSTLTYVSDDDFSGVENFSYQVSDGELTSDMALIEITVEAVNNPPFIESVPGTSAFLGEAYIYDVSATDPDGDELLYALTDSPEGMIITPGSGLISWIAPDEITDAVQVSVVVTDPQGLSDVQTYQIEVKDIEAQCIPGDAINVSFDGFIDTTSLKLNGDSEIIYPTDAEGVLRLTGSSRWQAGSAFLEERIPLADDSGFEASFSTFFSFRISNPGGISDNDGDGADGIVFVIQTVSNEVGGSGVGIGYQGINTSLGIEYDTYNNGSRDKYSGNHVGVNINGSGYSRTLKVIEDRMNDGDIWYSWIDYDGSSDSLEVRLSLDYTRPEEPLISYQVDLASVLEQEDAYVGFTSGTGEAWGDHDILSWQFINTYSPIGDCNQPYFTSIPPQQIPSGSSYVYTPVGVNFDDGIFSIFSAPDGAYINASTGILEWVPVNDDIGTHSIIIEYTGSDGLYAKQKFTLVVTNQSGVYPEIYTVPETEVYYNQVYEYIPEASDPNETGLRWSLETYPQGMTFTDGVISWEPGEENIGEVEIKVEAMDGYGLRDSQVYLLAVKDPNQPPIFTDAEESIEITAGEALNHVIPASDPEGEALTFEIISGPDGLDVSGDGVLNWNSPAVSSDQEVAIEVLVSDPRGLSATYALTLYVTTVEVDDIPPALEAATDSVELTAGETLSYSIPVIWEDDTEFTFDIVSAPTGMTVSQQGVIEWITLEDYGDLDFDVSVRISDDASNSNVFILSVTLTAYVNTAPVVASEPSTEVLAGDLYEYQIAAIDDDGDVLGYELQTAPEGMEITATGLLQWTPVESQEGIHTVQYAVSDGRASVVQQFEVAVIVENEAPVLTSVPAGSIVVGTTYSYQMIAADADGDELLYSIQSAPDVCTIKSSTGLFLCEFGDDDIGNYPIILKVEDPRGEYVLQSYTLVVTRLNNDFTITSTPPQNARVGVEFSYYVVVDNPDEENLTYQLLQAPDGMVIDDIGVISWTPADGQGGEADIVYEVSDGEFVHGQTFTIPVQSADTELQATLVVPERIGEEGDTLTVQAGFTGHLGHYTEQLSYDGELVTIDANGYASVILSGSGKHSFVYHVEDDLGADEVSASVYVRDPTDLVPPTAMLVDLVTDQSITAPVDITTTIEDDQLIYWQLLGYRSHDDEPVILAEGDAAAAATTTLARLDPTTMMNGQYTLVLMAQDLGGNKTYDSATLLIEGGMKVGNFSMAFEDISLPVSGIPVVVTRQYDSRRRAENLDFGYGWSVDYQNILLEESAEPTQGWNTYSSHATFLVDEQPVSLTAMCINSTSAKRVTVTLPNGDVEAFKVVGTVVGTGGESPYQEGCYMAGSTYVSFKFEAINGTSSSLHADAADSMYVLSNDGDMVDLDTSAVMVSDYILTTREGYIYYLNQDFGIRYIEDPNGNRLTYTDSGITHSSGIGISFERDAEGRITRMTDPADHVYEYAYDTQGDLTAYTDTEGNVTSFSYNGKHGLVDILDPLGRKVAKNIYDDDGRLIAQEDADGNLTEFDNNIEGRQSVVTDRNGFNTIFYYDDRGNVTTKVDALGYSTTYTYDDRGNETSVTNPLGETETTEYDEYDNILSITDALNNTTYYEYNDRNQEILITDPLQHQYTMAYDEFGGLVSITDANNQIATNEFDDKGQVIHTYDVLQGRTDYVYNDLGFKMRETDVLGVTTYYSYDDNGNVLSERRARTVNGELVDETTWYEYDSLNRLTKTAYPDGTSSETLFDEVGNEVTTIDRAGRATHCSYDVYRNLIEVEYPDGSTESHGYDSENNKTSSTDRAGRTTYFEYDKLNRQTITHYPDGTQVETEYNPGGRVSAEIDVFGHRTEYEYDQAGRRTLVRNALGEEHHYDYDDNGNLLNETDALGRVTRYEYNKLDQRVAVIHADTTTTASGMDALGRRTSSTDQAGMVTGYEYDAEGRLLAVIDAYLQRTEYEYDQAGNRIRQTDANNHSTLWTYNSNGQVLTRTLPEGQVESFSYDNAGNTSSHTDFNGDTSHYQYDLMGQLLRVDYSDGSYETYQYDLAGNRTSATLTDDQGTRSWYYQFDDMDRQTGEDQPNGSRIEYGYDLAGNILERRVIAAGETSTVSYSYDALNRLQTLTDNHGQTTRYEYNKVGSVETVVYPNGVSQNYQYDSVNRLQTLTTQSADASVIAKLDYEVDNTGRRTAILENSGRESHYD
ncbi:putative Ig domain-containing protein, partial [Oceanobacter mangrovi]|uniref:putative Ig domain-containing protein n=1 Tax=Oceanobacter mangrovi TaxID=2862510 RepID=UPI001C8DA054